MQYKIADVLLYITVFTFRRPLLDHMVGANTDSIAMTLCVQQLCQPFTSPQTDRYDYRYSYEYHSLPMGDV
jgi:hypothetical protein